MERSLAVANPVEPRIEVVMAHGPWIAAALAMVAIGYKLTTTTRWLRGVAAEVVAREG